MSLVPETKGSVTRTKEKKGLCYINKRNNNDDEKIFFLNFFFIRLLFVYDCACGYFENTSLYACVWIYMYVFKYECAGVFMCVRRDACMFVCICGVYVCVKRCMHIRV